LNTDLKYYIALAHIEGIGPILAKNLISYCSGVKNIFDARKKQLSKIPGIGPTTLNSINKFKNAALTFADKELKFIEQNNIEAITFQDPNYPYRLKQCADSPIVLFKQGNAKLNVSKIISIVGTRRCTDYGRHIVRKFVEELKKNNITVVSGLAYGIDYFAHKNAVENDIPNIAVVAHGLDMIYPALHKKLSSQIIKNGALITEFPSNTIPNKENFPKRNRIVAGICDATIVVESSIKGGAIITAYLARDYNRDVFAFPGRINDSASNGCNNLIKKNIAGLIENTDDLLCQLGWQKESNTNKSKTRQTTLMLNLTKEEDAIVSILKAEEQGISVDKISLASKKSLSNIAGTLLALEMKNIVEVLPGNKYKLLT